LQQAIAKAQRSPHAAPGKIAVIGFATGGGGALAYAERQPAAVSIVIAYDPETAFIARSTHVKAFVRSFQVPLVVFAAGKDKFKNCCLLRTVTAMDANANEFGKPMELVVYPHAEHNFIAGRNFRARETADAWRRTTAALKDYLDTASTH
jgi:dienelactone hydrolase